MWTMLNWHHRFILRVVHAVFLLWEPKTFFFNHSNFIQGSVFPHQKNNKWLSSLDPTGWDSSHPSVCKITLYRTRIEPEEAFIPLMLFCCRDVKQQLSYICYYRWTNVMKVTKPTCCHILSEKLLLLLMLFVLLKKKSQNLNHCVFNKDFYNHSYKHGQQNVCGCFVCFFIGNLQLNHKRTGRTYKPHTKDPECSSWIRTQNL